MNIKKLIDKKNEQLGLLHTILEVESDISNLMIWMRDKSDLFPALRPNVRKDINHKERALKRLKKMYVKLELGS